MKTLSGAVPAHILQRVTTLRRLDEALRDCLPAECRSHCRAAGLSGATLHLVADSPAWRTRLRFHSSMIINHIRDLGKFPVTRVDIRVSRSMRAPVGTPRQGSPRTMPVASARAFAALADETADDDLRRALRRLARHARED